MKKMSTGSKILIVILSLLFVFTFWLTELISGGITNLVTKQIDGVSFLFMGIGFLLINICILFALINIIKKIVNNKNVDKYKAFFYILFVIPLCLNIYVPFINPYPAVGFIVYAISYLLILLLYCSIVKKYLKKN